MESARNLDQTKHQRSSGTYGSGVMLRTWGILVQLRWVTLTDILVVRLSRRRDMSSCSLPDMAEFSMCSANETYSTVRRGSVGIQRWETRFAEGQVSRKNGMTNAHIIPFCP